MDKKIIYVDMDNVMCNFSKRHKSALAKEPEVAYPQSQYGFFRKLEPIQNAIKSVNFLRQQALFDIYILTAPSVYNPFSYTEKRVWIEEHFDFDFVRKLIISPNKGLNKGHYLIDDHASGSGQENFEGKVLHFGTADFPDWDSIIHYFTKTYAIPA